jgi:hypothetical protein
MFRTEDLLNVLKLEHTLQTFRNESALARPPFEKEPRCLLTPSPDGIKVVRDPVTGELLPSY